MSSDEVTILPRGRLVQATFQFVVPEAATKDEILRWVANNLNYGGIKADSPLASHGMEVLQEPTLMDSGLHVYVTLGEPDGDGARPVRYHISKTPPEGPVTLSQAVMADYQREQRQSAAE